MAENVRSVFVPDELRSHPLVANRTFYTFPPKLWAEFHEAVSSRIRDSEIAEVDRVLSGIADAIPGCVGFNDGVEITDCHLREPPSLDTDNPAVRAYLEKCRQDGFRVDAVIPLAKRRLVHAQESRRAYLGWLFTEPVFLAELRAFWEQFRLISPDQRAVPVGVAWEVQAGRPLHEPVRDSGREPAAELTDSFCRRWRLTQIVAPLTVCPLGVQFPALMATLSAAHAQTSGALLFIPDIAPLPDRDELRVIMENAVRPPRQEEHLAEWLDLVAADTQGRRRFDRYARWFPLQHYFRVIYGRYGEQLEGARDRVAAIVANYLRLTPDQLRDDLRDIRSRLGPDWLDPADCQFWST